MRHSRTATKMAVLPSTVLKTLVT